MLGAPPTCERAPTSRGHALGEPVQVQVRGCGCVVGKQVDESRWSVVGEQVSQKVVVEERGSRRSEVGVVVERPHELGVLFAGDQVVEQSSGGSFGRGQNAETEIDHVNRPAVVEVPSMSGSCGQRHLTGSRNEVLLNAHVRHDTWYLVPGGAAPSIHQHRFSAAVLGRYEFENRSSVSRSSDPKRGGSAARVGGGAARVGLFRSSRIGGNSTERIGAVMWVGGLIHDSPCCARRARVH